MLTVALTAASLLLFHGCDECRNLPNGIIMDENGRSWTQHPDWDVPAQAFDFDGLDAALDAGTFTPWPDPVPSDLVECWEYGSRGDYGHTCMLSTACYDLSAIPIGEIWGVIGPCPGAPSGVWDYAVEGAFGCYGVFEELGLAVALD